MITIKNTVNGRVYEVTPEELAVIRARSRCIQVIQEGQTRAKPPAPPARAKKEAPEQKDSE